MGPLTTPWLVHSVIPRSLANGPGVRFTIWSQGCALACPGCFNPSTHGPEGQVSSVREMVEAVMRESPHIDGVTLSGGEPLEQPEAVAGFCAELKTRAELGIVVLTGFTRAEIERDPAKLGAVASVDMVIAGRYNAARHLGTGLRGSSNKVYWALTSRYRPADFTEVPEAEVVIGQDGTVMVTGMIEMGTTLR